MPSDVTPDEQQDVLAARERKHKARAVRAEGGGLELFFGLFAESCE